MVLILNPKAFKLPRVEKDKFVNLIRSGLDYNREKGFFSIKNYNNVEKLIETISTILGDEVVFQQTCTLCGRNFACSACNYSESCTTKNLPFSCVCPQCLKARK